MKKQVADVDLSAAGGAYTTGWTQMRDTYMAHSLFSTITGNGTVSCDIYVSPTGLECIVHYTTLYSNLTAQDKLSRLSLEATEWIRFTFTNNSPFEDSHIEAWLVQKGKTSEV